MFYRSILKLESAALLLGALLGAPVIASAAFESQGRGGYEIKGSATGGIPVSGNGTFTAVEQGGQLVFRANVGKDLDMGIRDEHTNKEFGITDNTELTVTVARSDLKIPGATPTVEAQVTGKLNFRNVTRDVAITYKVKQERGVFTVESASFSFDYTQFRPDKKGDDKKICRAIICVKPQIDVILKPNSLRLQDR